MMQTEEQTFTFGQRQIPQTQKSMRMKRHIFNLQRKQHEETNTLWTEGINTQRLIRGMGNRWVNKKTQDKGSKTKSNTRKTKNTSKLKWEVT